MLTSLAVAIPAAMHSTDPRSQTGSAAAHSATIQPVAAQTSAVTGITTKHWSSASDWRSGTLLGTAVRGDNVVMTSTAYGVTYDDPWGSRRGWYASSWKSGWQRIGFRATALNPSWNVTPAPGTFVQVLVRVRSASSVGSWDLVGTWAHTDESIHRASADRQSDDLANVNVDTVMANSGRTFDSYEIAMRILRSPDSRATPVVRSVTAVAAAKALRSQPTSTTTMAGRSRVLNVPPSSQMTHAGHYPQWGGGGEAWCSPTSVSMVLRYLKLGPPARWYSWVSGTSPWVDHAARYSYDNAYRGTGNWPFSTAYAGIYGADSFLGRLYDLREAEAYIRQGIPLVASIAFNRGALSNAPISASAGHLLIIVGFTRSGDVVVNDPAGASDSAVRRTYQRAEFERAWLGGSGGIVYVIHSPAQQLP